MTFHTTLFSFPLRRRKRDNSRRSSTPIPQVPVLDVEDSNWDLIQEERDGLYCDDGTSDRTHKSRFEWLTKAAGKLRGSSIDGSSNSLKSFTVARNTSPSEHFKSSPFKSFRFGSNTTCRSLLKSSRRLSSGSNSFREITSTVTFTKPDVIHPLGLELISRPPLCSSSTFQRQTGFKDSTDLGDHKDQMPIRPGLSSHPTYAHHTSQPQSLQFELRKVQSYDINLRAKFSAPNYTMLRYNPPKYSSHLNDISLPVLSASLRDLGSKSSGPIKSDLNSSMISTFSSLYRSTTTDPSVDEEELQDCFDPELNL
ncbi:hypothetical protein DFH28DRAFT_891824 [Melampsora americana]|nr:hypothetical protein DFH28DRAFT_891824 [Melampsora americana]